MKRPQPRNVSEISKGIHQLHIIPQYAHFLPKYLPRYGTRTMVRSSSSCCKLSLHSRSASESSSSSLGDIDVSEPASEDGSESTSSSVLAGGMLAYDEDGSDMMAGVLMFVEIVCVSRTAAAMEVYSLVNT
jgi:hypothetical protein